MEVPTEFIDCLARQRAAYLKDPVPSAKSRRADLEALHRMLTENEAEIVSAIDADFGVRSAVETRLLELFPVREGFEARSPTWKSGCVHRSGRSTGLSFPEQGIA